MSSKEKNIKSTNAKINPPKRSVLEEIGNSITHGIGSLLAIATLIVTLVYSDTAGKRAGALIYSIGLLIMFTVSCLYHAFAHGSTVKRLFRRFDYSSIYILIAATFAPVLLVVFGDTFGYIFFAIQWTVVAAGITLVAVFGPSRLRFIHIPLYVILGWSAIMLLSGMLKYDPPLCYFILAGGIVYSLGIIPFALHKKGSHFIWHFFVLAGALVQWFGIIFSIYIV